MKKYLILFVALFGIVLLGSCSEEPRVQDGQDEALVVEENPEIEYTSTLGLTAEESNVIKSNNDFAWNLFAKLNEGEANQNVVASPLSVSIALTMLANATTTDSEVRTEILNTLGYSDFELSDVNSAVMKLAEGIDRLDKDVVLALANSVWVNNQAIEVNPDFVALLKKDFKIESYSINRSTYISDVNNWCKVRTNGMISRFLEEDANVPDMALINATYFKGMWAENNKFDKALTKEDKFYTGNGNQSKVDFMNAKKYCESRKTGKMEMITLPFGNGNYDFCIVRPNDNVGIDECIGDIKSNWNEIASAKPSVEYLKVKLPKFDAEYANDIKSLLASLGMPKAMNLPDYYFAYPKGLQVEQVRHKARLRIDEEGAEAAAVTSIDLADTDNPDGPTTQSPEPRPFYLDHPFIYLITEKESGAIIFMGSVKSL